MQLLAVLLLVIVSTEAKRRLDVSRKMEDPKETDIDLARKIDVYAGKVSRPVPFGHIYREGFEDPRSELKQPIDSLDLDTVYLKDSDLAREYLKKFGNEFQTVGKRPPTYTLPRDELFERTQISEDTPRHNQNESRTYWNLASIQQRNMYDPPKRRIGFIKETVPQPETDVPNLNDTYVYFGKASFSLDKDPDSKPKNYTTCDDFAKNANFHPDDIVNIEWVPFYIWTYDLTGQVTVAKVHKFTHPTKKLVKKYKDGMRQHINQSLDWEQPKLLLKQDFMEMLLIAADRRGLFDGIPYSEIPEDMKKRNITLPLVPIRLKIVDPYLAMMYCDEQYITIMAVAGTEPRTIDAMTSEAAVLKITGEGFPVTRDYELESMIAIAAHEMIRNQDKFIHQEDQPLVLPEARASGVVI